MLGISTPLLSQLPTSCLVLSSLTPLGPFPRCLPCSPSRWSCQLLSSSSCSPTAQLAAEPSRDAHQHTPSFNRKSNTCIIPCLVHDPPPLKPWQNLQAGVIQQGISCHFQSKGLLSEDTTKRNSSAHSPRPAPLPGHAVEPPFQEDQLI